MSIGFNEFFNFFIKLQALTSINQLILLEKNEYSYFKKILAIVIFYGIICLYMSKRRNDDKYVHFAKRGGRALADR